MGLECGGGELRYYALWGMDVDVPGSIPRSFMRIIPYPKKEQVSPHTTPVVHYQLLCGHLPALPTTLALHAQARRKEKRWHLTATRIGQTRNIFVLVIAP